MWRPQGRHRTGTTGSNSLHPTQQWMETNDDDVKNLLDHRRCLMLDNIFLGKLRQIYDILSNMCVHTLNVRTLAGVHTHRSMVNRR